MKLSLLLDKRSSNDYHKDMERYTLFAPIWVDGQQGQVHSSRKESDVHFVNVKLDSGLKTTIYRKVGETEWYGINRNPVEVKS